MRAEWGDDQGTTSAAAHRAALVGWMEKTRAAFDAFQPDFILLWGDDQYENFREDIIPPYCIAAHEKFTFSPRPDNVWGETDKTYELPGNRNAAKMLATRLIEQGFDTAYAYKPLHHPLGHAFTNAIFYLDYHRKGFHYPIVPFAVNCYGRKVVSQHGGVPVFDKPQTEIDFDPPAPTPWRLFDLGAATARILAESPYRVALLASSGWSHAFLTAKNHFSIRTGRQIGSCTSTCGTAIMDVAEIAGTGCGRQRSAGDPELDVPGRCSQRAWAKAAGNRLRRHVDFQFVEGLPDRAARLSRRTGWIPRAKPMT